MKSDFLKWFTTLGIEDEEVNATGKTVMISGQPSFKNKNEKCKMPLKIKSTSSLPILNSVSQKMKKPSNVTSSAFVSDECIVLDKRAVARSHSSSASKLNLNSELIQRSKKKQPVKQADSSNCQENKIVGPHAASFVTNKVFYCPGYFCKDEKSSVNFALKNELKAGQKYLIMQKVIIEHSIYVSKLKRSSQLQHSLNRLHKQSLYGSVFVCICCYSGYSDFFAKYTNKTISEEETPGVMKDYIGKSVMLKNRSQNEKRNNNLDFNSSNVSCKLPRSNIDLCNQWAGRVKSDSVIEHVIVNDNIRVNSNHPPDTNIFRALETEAANQQAITDLSRTVGQTYTEIHGITCRCYFGDVIYKEDIKRKIVEGLESGHFMKLHAPLHIQEDCRDESTKPGSLDSSKDSSNRTVEDCRLVLMSIYLDVREECKNQEIFPIIPIIERIAVLTLEPKAKT